MTPRRELGCFAVTLALVVGGFFCESLFGGKVLSSADVLLASASFREVAPPNYEPQNRLLMDPTLQFEPWIEFNRRMLRSGRIPLWNSASGCGAPHLANGQAAVFDPFLLIAYGGPVPEAFARMAAARLWFAGLGMFLLTRAWGYGGWGRWFAGLTFPFTGFLVAWLLYPVTNAAIWLPWVFLVTHRVFDRPTARRAAGVALAVAGTLLGGHVQTAAHVLLAALAYAGWLTWSRRPHPRMVTVWAAGVIVGIGLAAVEVVPLAAYLSRSPVWADRDRERVEPWELARPRLLEAACTFVPSIYGSQRRGEPNLAKAVGADNQNEAAGGYAGLVTLIWLAPLAWTMRRGNPRISFLAGLTLFGAAAAFRLPPIDNILRSLPVLKVTDNRRMTLWVAFGLVALGGSGLDRLEAWRPSRAWRVWALIWAAVAVGCLAGSVVMRRWEPTIRARADAHYAKAALATAGADPAEYMDRARRQTESTLAFVPHTLTVVALEGLFLAGLLWCYGRGRMGPGATRACLLGLTLAEMLRFGFGLNPAIDRALDRPTTSLIADLQHEIGRRGRIIGLGAEFPPNVLMRYGLLDARNYDSVEVGRSLDWFQPLYDPTVAARTSRREITWDRVERARERLKVAGVAAIVAASPPPPEFTVVQRYGSVWVARIDADPLIDLDGPGRVVRGEGSDGRFDVEVVADGPARLIVRETFDPGWAATVNGVVAPIEPEQGTFLAVAVGPGSSRIVLRYDPTEFRVAEIIATIAGVAVVFALTGSLDFRSTRSAVSRLGRTQALGLESDS